MNAPLAQGSQSFAATFRTAGFGDSYIAIVKHDSKPGVLAIDHVAVDALP
ncbi:hypothetical protein [Paenibacillus sp. MBLB4367]